MIVKHYLLLLVLLYLAHPHLGLQRFDEPDIDCLCTYTHLSFVPSHVFIVDVVFKRSHRCVL